MRIVSLLPSATEIVYALGLGDQLVGVTHECDWPAVARTKRRVSNTTIPHGADASEIDRLVTASVNGGPPTNALDIEAFRDLQPDLVISQDLCAVCAVPAGDVGQALDVIGCTAEVISLDPSSLAEVFAGIHAVGAATGNVAVATRYVERLEDRLAIVAERVRDQPRRRTFALEWSDPPFNGGHWVPEMIALAGGTPVLGEPGEYSVRVRWDEIAAVEPEVVVFMPCGYDLARAVAESATFSDRPELSGVAEIYATNANAYFSRPGPRLVDGVEILASVLHPHRVRSDAVDAISRVR